MRTATLILAALLALWGSSARGGAPPMPLPKGAKQIGTVAARRGTRVTLVLEAGASVKGGTQLLVVAQGQERRQAHGEWDEVGRIQIRLLRGTTCATGSVVAEVPRKGPDGGRVANIRPGDTVYTSGSGPEPAPKASVPPTNKGR